MRSISWRWPSAQIFCNSFTVYLSRWPLRPQKNGPPIRGPNLGQAIDKRGKGEAGYTIVMAGPMREQALSTVPTTRCSRTRCRAAIRAGELIEEIEPERGGRPLKTELGQNSVSPRKQAGSLPPLKRFSGIAAMRAGSPGGSTAAYRIFRRRWPTELSTYSGT
jgi:hypothetical protein